MLHAKSDKHIKHNKLIAVSRKKSGYSMTLARPEPIESNQKENDDRDKRNRSSF